MPAKNPSSLFLGFQDFWKNSDLIFVMTKSKEVKLDFYKKARRRRHNFPITFTTTLEYIGVTSLAISTVMRETETGLELARNFIQYVHIDGQTRKSKPLPQSFRRQFVHFVNQSKPPIVKPLILPKHLRVHRYSVTVAPSDTDANNHCNNASYVKYCMDAATEASRKGFYSNFLGDVCRYCVKNMQNYFAGECVSGDLLDVYTWSEAESPWRIYFLILKQDKPIFHNSMEFYAEPKTKL